MRKTPQAKHEKEQFRSKKRHPTERWEQCYECTRQLANCKKKIRFAEYEEAAAWRDEFNETLWRGGSKSGVAVYYCNYCEGFHMTSATTKFRFRKLERARRKWLIERRAAGEN